MTGVALVTGTHGFIGRHVARVLAREGWSVSGIGHGQFDPQERRAWGLQAHAQADVTLANLAASSPRPELIVHCAGGSSVGFSTAHPLEDFERTVATTAAVLEYARVHCGGATIVYPSSAAVYGTTTMRSLPESAPLKPISPYGVHKRLVEELCSAYVAQFGVRAVIVRLFSVYGAGLRKQLLWDACNRARQGDLSFFGSGREVRDWLHVEDAASLLARAGQVSVPACSIINGGTGIGVPVAEVLGELLKCLGVSGAPRFTGAARLGDPEALVADNAAALATGWRPSRDWRSGVKEYADWFTRTAR